MNHIKNYIAKIRIRSKQPWMFLVAIFLMYYTTSCSSNSKVPSQNVKGLITETLEHRGVERTYHLYFPKTYNKATPAPMVLALHGGGGSGKLFEQHASAGTLTAAAEKRGVVLVFPEGKDKRWNSGRTEIFNGAKMYDDVGFISALIDKMIQHHSIDASRIYATGISNGGFMSIRLALDLSEKIVAVAPVTAQLAKVNQDKRPGSPISIMIINGTKDPLVPYNGGHIRLFRLRRSRGELLSTHATINKFKGFNQCSRVPEREPLLNAYPNDKTQVEIVKYTGCQEVSEVILVKVIGGGHTWPGGSQYLKPERVGVVSKEINASELILDFFLNHKN